MADAVQSSLTIHHRLLNSIFFPPRQLPVNITYNILNRNVAQEHHGTNSHTIIAFIIPVLLNFIEVKYQGTSNSPFETHPLATIIAVTSLLAYSIACTAELRFSHHLSPICAQIFQSIKSMLSSLSLASLASILFFDVVQHILYIIYTMLLVVELYDPVNKLYHWIHQKVVRKLISALHAQHWQIRRTSPMLPLTFTDTGSLLPV